MIHNGEERMRLNYEEKFKGTKVMNVVKVDPEAIHKKYIIPPLENILKKPKNKQKHLIHLKTREP